MNEFDVVVIGGGPGGYVAAVRASQLGLKTALIEKDQLGGTCVNWGCIPTKTLLRNAEVVRLLSLGRTFGFQCDNVSIDYASAQNRSRQVAKRQGKRVEALLKNRNINVFRGEARLDNETSVTIVPSGDKISGKNIIVATGSRPRQIPIAQFDGEKIISVRTALQLIKPPASVVIIGGGPIGMEFATIWNRYGSKVTVLEMMPRIIPAMDEDICAEAKAHFLKRGVKIRTGVRVEGVIKTPAGVEVNFLDGETKETIAAEKVLIAAGFAPNTGDLGLEQAGVMMNRGYIEVNAQMRSSIPNIYAIGDITGKLCLAHVASAQGTIAAENLAGNVTKELIYENIPGCVFGEIEIGSVGLTEKTALERGLDIMTVKSPLASNGKAVAINENSGFVKLIADKRSKKLLGAHLIGSHAAELVAIPAGIIAIGAGIEQAAQVIYPHPALSEAILEGLHALDGRAIHI